MDNCKEILDSECSVAHDLKEDLGSSSISCVSENVNEREQSIEDKNCNITIMPSKGKVNQNVDDKTILSSSSSSPSKDKSNVKGVHVGPNGLINGLDLEPSGSLSQLLEHIPNSVVHDNLCNTDNPSSSHNKILNDISEIKTAENNERTHDLECSKNKIEILGAPVPNISEQTEDVSGENSNKAGSVESEQSEIEYVSYKSELQMPDIMRLIQKDLSEPYSIYTYRYFIHNWPKLCFLAMDGSKCVGAIVCKLDIHRKVVKRGYIAMLAVDEKYRKRKIGSNLVLKAIRAMVADDADEVVLETEITNRPALRLYENLGFVRDKRLFRYYLNGVDALRLKLWLR